MKKGKLIMLLLLLAFSIVGCGKNIQDSSAEEAKYVVLHLPDFKEFIQYFSIQSTGSNFSLVYLPQTYQSEPKLTEKNKEFVHQIIYKNKDEELTLVLMDDSRPPKIIATRKLK